MSVVTFVLLGMVLAIFSLGVYQLLRKHGLKLKVGGTLELSFGAAKDEAPPHVSELSSSTEASRGALRPSSQAPNEINAPSRPIR